MKFQPNNNKISQQLTIRDLINCTNATSTAVKKLLHFFYIYKNIWIKIVNILSLMRQ